jgi:UDP-glucuronate decarboxylase
MTGSRSRIMHRPLPENDPRQRRPDISRAQEVLSWKPRTPLKEGLVRTIAYFEDLLKQEGVRATLTAN